MTVRTTTLQNRAAGLPAEDHRLIRSFFVPGTTLLSLAGVLAAPAGYRGEVTLLGPQAVRVNPGRWILPGTQSGVQGDYTVVNDAALDLGVGAQDASLTRIDRLVVQVRDTAYTPNEGVDDPAVRVMPGTPSATGAAAPAVPANGLSLGTITVPPTGGTVTFTPASIPRQVALGGVQPVGAADPLTTPGRFDGQLRDHPTSGLQRWSETTASWDRVTVDRIRSNTVTAASTTSTGHALQIGADNQQNLIADSHKVEVRDGAGNVAKLWINSDTGADGKRGDVGITHGTFIGDAATTNSQAQALVIPRLRLTATADAAAAPSATPSTQHALQIGADNAQNLIIDQNEIIVRGADGTGAALYLEYGVGLGTIDYTTAAANMVTRLDYVNGTLLNCAYATGFGDWGSTFVGLTATRVGNLISLTGVVKNSNILTAPTVVTTLTATYRPAKSLITTTRTGAYSNGAGRVDIGPDGVVQIVPDQGNYPANTWSAILAVYNVKST